MKATNELTRGEKVYSRVHRAWVRVVAVEGVWVRVADANTGKELPDLVHRDLLERNPAR